MPRKVDGIEPVFMPRILDRAVWMQEWDLSWQITPGERPDGSTFWKQKSLGKWTESQKEKSPEKWMELEFFKSGRNCCIKW